MGENMARSDGGWGEWLELVDLVPMRCMGTVDTARSAGESLTPAKQLCGILYNAPCGYSVQNPLEG